MPRMTEEEVLKVARETAEAELWPWEGPFSVRFKKIHLLGRERQWAVLSNLQYRGRNVSIWVEDETGNVLSKVYIPR